MNYIEEITDVDEDIASSSPINKLRSIACGSNPLTANKESLD
jgi:hypothetical protein